MMLETIKKNVVALKNETTRVLGPIVDTNCKLLTLAENINDRLTVLQRTGRTEMHVGFKPSVVLPFMSHKSDEVRAMASQLVPQRFVSQLKNDPSAKVRTIVANRSSSDVVREMMRRFPKDEELRLIYKAKSTKQRLSEATEDERIEDLIDDVADHELTQEWYDSTAAKLIELYGKSTVTDVWIHSAINNLVNHTKATSGVELDAERLLDSVEELLSQKEKKHSLKELAQRLFAEAEDEE